MLENPNHANFTSKLHKITDSPTINKITLSQKAKVPEKETVEIPGE